jgi:CRISPR/Cas system-associated endonuclease Cas3-HD
MNTIVNITGLTLNLSNVNVEKDMLKKLRAKERTKLWTLKNKEQKIKYNKEWYIKNKEKILKKEKEWRTKNKLKIRERRKWRRHNDIVYNLLCNLRGRIKNVLKGKSLKSKKTKDLLGCNGEEFKKYIESKFKLGMNWEKRHLIHIDHILPCSSFDLTKPEEQAQCFHYTNLQPLWASENLAKGSKIS